MIEYIKGTDNIAADALSRISIDEIKNINIIPSDIFAITRSMTKQINEKQIENDNNLSTKSEIIPNCVEELGSRYDKSIPRMRTLNLHQFCAYASKKKLFRIDLKDAIVNKNFALEQHILELERVANELRFSQLQWPNNDLLFQYININDFKEKCNRYLKNLTLISQPKKIIDENEKLEILKKFHNDPVTGGHYGSKSLYAKLRSFFYWKDMSKTITNYVKSCQVNKITKHTKQPLTLTQTSQKPFDLMILDTIA